MGLNLVATAENGRIARVSMPPDGTATLQTSKSRESRPAERRQTVGGATFAGFCNYLHSLIS